MCILSLQRNLHVGAIGQTESVSDRAGWTLPGTLCFDVMLFKFSLHCRAFQYWKERGRRGRSRLVQAQASVLRTQNTGPTQMLQKPLIR